MPITILPGENVGQLPEHQTDRISAATNNIMNVENAVHKELWLLATAVPRQMFLSGANGL